MTALISLHFIAMITIACKILYLFCYTACAMIFKLMLFIDFRLLGNNNEGGLEFNSGNGWLPVCATESFNHHAADIACSQLHYLFSSEFRQISGSTTGVDISVSNCQTADNVLSCAVFQEMHCEETVYLKCFSKLDLLSVHALQ